MYIYIHIHTYIGDLLKHGGPPDSSRFLNMFLSQGRGTVGEGQSDAHHQGAHSGRLHPAVPAVFWMAKKRGKTLGKCGSYRIYPEHA